MIHPLTPGPCESFLGSCRQITVERGPTCAPDPFRPHQNFSEIVRKKGSEIKSKFSYPPKHRLHALSLIFRSCWSVFSVDSENVVSSAVAPAAAACCAWSAHGSPLCHGLGHRRRKGKGTGSQVRPRAPPPLSTRPIHLSTGAIADCALPCVFVMMMSLTYQVECGSTGP